jgi:hypothetical protein
MENWIALATTGSVVRRAAKTAVVVGAFLVAINQGDAILHHDMPASRWLRMLLTVMVPYMVSTTSSVQAMRESASGPPSAER